MNAVLSFIEGKRNKAFFYSENSDIRSYDNTEHFTSHDKLPHSLRYQFKNINVHNQAPTSIQPTLYKNLSNTKFKSKFNHATDSLAEEYSSLHSSNSALNNRDLYHIQKTPKEELNSVENCRLDVRATSLGGLGSILPFVHHLFLVLTNRHGVEVYYRGGPGGTQCANTKENSGPNGSILGSGGHYIPGSIDWDPSAPSKTVLTGRQACDRVPCLAKEIDRINNNCIPYEIFGNNSNTLVSTLLDKCNIPKSKPVALAPGWDESIL
ncbi:MAG: hypothetical protein V3T17_10815 [Pseudomonadales bacterium]